MPVPSAAGLALTRTAEGCVLFAFDDAVYPTVAYVAGTPLAGTLTAGWGHTGADVAPGPITQDQADRWLAQDLADAAAAVASLVTQDLGDNRASALVDFVFNEGRAALAQSSALAIINASPSPLHVPEHLRLWDEAMVGGTLQPVAGLWSRRVMESLLWRLPDAAPVPDFAAVRQAADAAYPTMIDLDPYLDGVST